MLAGSSLARADVLVNDFEGGDTGGWFGWNSNIAPIGVVTNPTGSSGNWMYITLESGTWTTAGPTRAPWANATFNDSLFQANNFLQFDVILPSMDGAAAVGYPQEGWVSGLSGTLGLGISTDMTDASDGEAPGLASVNIGSLDVVQHVVIDYSSLKSSGGGLHYITWGMNIQVDHPDETPWNDAGLFLPQMYFDNIYLTTTSAIPLPTPGPNDGTWDVTKSGDWLTSGNTNWVGGVAANGTMSTATFGQAAAARTVNNNALGIGLATIILDSTNGYTITGNGIGLGGAGTASLNVLSGDHELVAPLSMQTGTFTAINVAANSSVKIDDFTVSGYGMLNVTGQGTASVNRVANCSVNVDGGATLSLLPGNAQNNGFLYYIGTGTDSTVNFSDAQVFNNSMGGVGTIIVGGMMTTGKYLASSEGPGEYSYYGALMGTGSVLIEGASDSGNDETHNTIHWLGPVGISGGITLNNSNLETTSVGSGPLTINAGNVTVTAKGTPNTGTSKIPSLTIAASGATLDLTNNSLVIDYTGPVGTLVDDTRQNLQSGKITSSSADANHRLGYADNAILHKASFGGVDVDDSSLLIKFTYGGDANLDGQVDVTDLGALATNWQTSNVWTGGDFNYDGFVDVTDLGILATDWQQGVGSPLGPGSLQAALASVGLGNVSVPEPASIGVIGIGLAAAASRRRTRRGRRG